MVRSRIKGEKESVPMLFSSVPFIFYFLPIFLAIYYIFGLKNSVLLAGSMLFYIWGEGLYILLLIGLVILNQIISFVLSKKTGKARLVVLVAIICFDIAILAIFKYSQFILNILGSVFFFTPAKLGIHLPLGISFFTFQLISYIVEVYRGNIPPERDFLKIATYVMMFPHLVAGPIVRYGDISGELGRRHVDVDKIGLGVQYFIIGLSQKVIIANVVASAADHAFGLPASSLSAASAWIGTFAYTLQIYFDFCGYSNMAIGLAFLLGFRFPKNFDYPYTAKSISEFWRRWHMSLSFWFRDYLYIPLGGSRVGTLRTVFNLAIVFVVTGLWHGAAWNFMLWGALHGSFVIFEHLGGNNLLKRIPDLLRRCYTLIIVMVAWVVFRSDSLPHTIQILKAMAGFGSEAKWDPLALWVTPEILAAFVLGSIFSFPVLPCLLDKLNLDRLAGPSQHASAIDSSVSKVHRIPSIVLLSAFVFSIFLLISSTLNPFLYFRF